MYCQSLLAWSRTIQHVAGQQYDIIHSHPRKVLLVLFILTALEYLAYLASQNSSIKGSIHTSMDKILSPMEKVTVGIGNSSSILTPNAVGNASSIVFNISVSSVNQTTTTSVTVSYTGKPLCPPIPPNLTGTITVLNDSLSFDELEKKFPMLELGGHYRPEECQARDRVAIIVPYRDREQHLRTFLLHLHPLLQRQQLDYRINVVEQGGDGPFNRAMLMNVGFVEALKLYNYDCFIFHDVDLLPEDDRNLYNCPEQPRHMSVAVDIFNYKLPYESIFGGVSALTRTQFLKVNGFSNEFWGWGGEDDDMSNRVRYHGYNITRYPANLARYKSLTHRKAQANPKRFDLLNTGKKRFETDGLNSLQYNVKELSLNKLYTRVLVEIATPS